VQGSGFFVVSDSAGDLYLTRNGSFVADASGNLVNSAGYYLMGSNVQSGAAPPANALSSLEKVNVSSSGETASPTTSASISANLPSTATPIAAANLPSANSANSTYTDQTSLVVYDNLGGAHTINIYFANTGANTWEVDAYDASDAAPGGGFPYSSGPLATSTLTFDPANGTLSSGSPLSIAVPGGQTMNLDLSQVTQLAAGFSMSAATANGNAPASLEGVSIASNGTMSFNYTNGASIAAYDIPLANVASPDFLTSVNGNAYEANANSGPVFLGSAGAGSFGSIDSSSLESSTVDLATELTNMIEAQSAYEANSKVFQTGANILDVLNGLKA
jgi:flagellar hook protein FlgE